MTRLSTTGRARPSSTWTAVALFVVVTWMAGGVAAQETTPGKGKSSSGETSDETGLTLTKSVPAPVGDGEWRLQVEPVKTESGDWKLSLRMADGSAPAAEVALPDWAGPPEYGLEARAAAIAERDAVVLVDIVPDVETPTDKTKVTLQLAWRGRLPAQDDPKDRQAWTWELLSRTQFSTLDGGNQLTLRTRDDQTELIRKRQEASSTFCGPGGGDDVTVDVFSPEKDRFVQSVNLERHLNRATTLEASLPETAISGPFTRGVYQWYWASSDLTGASDSNHVVRPMELGDRRGQTGWRVGGDREIRGEYATANISNAVPVEAFHIVPGLTQSASSFRKYRLPKRLLLSLSDGSTYTVEVPNVDYESLTARRGLVVELPEPVRTSCVTLAHLEAYEPEAPGADADAVVISEMTPVTTVDAPTARETAERVVEIISEKPDLRNRERIAHIASGLSDELVGAVDRALETTEGLERRRVIPLLSHLPSERAVPMLIDFLENLDSDAVEYRAVKRSLAVHRQEAAEPLRDLLFRTSVDEEKYIDLVRLLGRVGRPIDLAGLVEEFGRGDQFIRNERIRATASAGNAVLPKLFAVVGVESSSAKSRDALKTAYLIGKRKNDPELLDHDRADVLAEVLRRSEDRRTLMLAFRAAKYFRVDNLVSIVERRFVDYPDPLVRKSAMTALARYPAPESRHLLETALDDKSPDVRISAVSALGQREDRTRSLDPLLQYARYETWQPGQQQALKVLAEVDVPKVQEFFHSIIDEQRNAQIAILAANTLGRANRTIDPQLARDVILDSDAPDRLRLEMIDLLGLDDSDPGEAFLLTLLNPVELGREVEDRDLRRKFERRSLLALGRRRSAPARSRLLKMVKTGSDRKLRQHALRALAFYKGEDLVETLQEWRPDAPPELRNTLDQTIRIIENRGAIEDVDKQIEATMEAEQSGKESSEETDDDSSPPDNGQEGKNGESR